MADNTVQLKIQGEDDAGGAFAKASAEAKAFAAVVRDAGRAEVKANVASSEAIGAHGRALRLLHEAEQVAASDTERLGTGAERAGGLFSRLTGAITSLATSALSALLQSMSQLPGTLGTIAAQGPVGIGILAALAAAATAATFSLVPLVASLGLVAAGIGGFALIAAPEISKVFTALTQHGKALTATMRTLSPAERDLVRQTEPLKDEFGKLQKAIQPYIIQAFAQGIRILKDLFPALRPLVEAAGKALDGFLKNIANWLNGPSGKKFIAWMQTEGPKAIATFGRALWDIMRVAGTVFHYLYDQGETTDRIFKVIFHGIAFGIDTLRMNLVGMGHTFESVWNTVVGIVRGAASAIAGAIGTITSALSSVNSALGGIPGKVLGALGFGAGGVVGAAATGGIRSGFQLVGERGPELVRLPTGSTVFNAGQTANMLGGGAGGVTQLQVVGGQDEFSQFMARFIRNWVRVNGGDPSMFQRKVAFR